MQYEELTFEDFYNRYYTTVVCYLQKRIQSMADSEDLAQEIFTYCYKKYDEYDASKSSAKTWLFVVVAGRLKNYYRDMKKDVSLEELEEILPDDRNTMEEAVYIEETRQAIAKALLVLPEMQRKAVIYKYFHKKSHAEIAELLGISEMNSRVILSRALKYMKNYLKNF